MKNKITSQYMYFFNMLIFGIGMANSCYMSILMNNDAKYSWLIPISLIIPFIILMLFIKNKPVKSSFISKFVIFIYSILSNALLIYYSSVILTNWFYEESSIFLFICLFGFVLTTLGLIPASTILRVGFIWSIVYGVIALMGISFHNESNIMFLFPMELNTKIFTSNIFFLIIPLDNLVYLFLDVPNEDFPKKKTIIISGILVLILSTIQLIINLTLVNYRFYEDLETPAIEVFFMYFSKNHLGHYDIVLIINILTTLFYKGILYSNLTLQLFPQSKRKFIIPFIALLIIPISILLIFNKHLKYYLSIIIFIVLLLIYIILIIFQRSKKLNDLS